MGWGGGEPGLRQKAFEDVGVGLRMLGSKDKQVLRDASGSDGARDGARVRLCVVCSQEHKHFIFVLPGAQTMCSGSTNIAYSCTVRAPGRTKRQYLCSRKH